MTTAIIIILIIITLFGIFSIYRLNIYISTLEEKILKQIELSENLKQSIKEIVIEGVLENDGRLKKFNIQKETNFIYNGNKVDENNYEL